MKSVPHLDRVAEDDLQFCIDRAADDAERKALDARKAEVLAQYAAYALGVRRPHEVERSKAWQGSAHLEALWRHRSINGPIRDLWGETIAAAGKCVFCNSRFAEEADHFLPKTHYPALAVLHLNLVGTCSRCNKHKSSSSTGNPSKQFVHPYFDLIPREQVFLHCTPFDGLVFAPLYRVDPPGDWQGDVGMRLTWQFRRLKLDGYYRQEAISWFSNQAYGWLQVARGGWDGLAATLNGALESHNRSEGPNTWTSATIRGLLEDDAFRAAPVGYILRNGPPGLRADD